MRWPCGSRAPRSSSPALKYSPSATWHRLGGLLARAQQPDRALGDEHHRDRDATDRVPRPTRGKDRARAHRAPTIVRRVGAPPKAMRLAILSDIHANLPALEAVLADSRTRASTRSGAWATSSATAPSPTSAPTWSAERVLAVPGRQPRPRRARRARHLDLLPRRRGRGRWTSEHIGAETRRLPARRWSPADESREVGALPRLPARPRLGVRALARPGSRVHPGAGAPGQPSSAIPTSPCSSRFPTRAADGRLARGRARRQAAPAPRSRSPRAAG